MSLEGKLNGVSVGDVIKLMNPPDNQEVSGYVTKLTNSVIKFSHENPNKKTGYYSRSGFTKGDRLYFLMYFKDYKVLDGHSLEPEIAAFTAPRDGKLSLVGKLNGVSVGDVIQLLDHTSNVEVAGYVAILTQDKIKVSHENPTKDAVYSNRRTGITKGDRTFFLNSFDDYKLLDKQNP